jgi:hypothetical protein
MVEAHCITAIRQGRRGRLRRMCEDTLPKAFFSGCETYWFERLKADELSSYQNDGELSVIVIHRKLCYLYYSTITAGFQPVFLFLYGFL